MRRSPLRRPQPDATAALRPSAAASTYAAFMAATHLVVLGNADAARWVFDNQRMAFSEVGRRTAARLARGDTLLFYASLKCWPALGGPRPDSGLLLADAVVLTDVARMNQPAYVGGRHFHYGCEVFFEHL